MVSRAVPKIPVVDLSAFTSGGDLLARRQAANLLAEKVHQNGSVGISGHGLSTERLREAFAVAKTLFGLPYDQKMKAPHPDATVPHRETDDEEEQDQYLNTSDYKESYEVGSEENKVQYNIWLPEDVLPGFRQFTMEFFWELNNIANKILDALIMSLNLTEEEAIDVRALHHGHDNQLRLLHYPSIPVEMLKDSSVGRLGAHTDWSSFTLLFQDESSGLEFGDRETGEFVPATPTEGVVYMNIGDMFQRISNGFYPSARHRVVISGKRTGNDTPARYSIPFFVVPRSDDLVTPRPSLVALQGKQIYESVTFNDYSEKMSKITQGLD